MKNETQQYSATSEYKIIRLPYVMQLVGLGRSSIYAKIKLAEFPAPIKIGSRASGWILHEVNSWVAERIAASRTKGVV